MEERYSRNIPALTEKEQELLRHKRIFIAGCGGLGGYILEYMLRIGVGAISFADGDRFEKTNLNRQLLSEEELIGCSKAETAKMRAAKINPEVEIRSYPVFVDEKNARSLIAGCDAVMDALDNPDSRKILVKACAKEDIPYIYGAISGWLAQAAIIMPGEPILDMLYTSKTNYHQRGVLSFTPALCAAMQCSLCAKLLCGHKQQSGVLYCLDMHQMEFEKFIFT